MSTAAQLDLISCLLVSVHGPSDAAPDASQAPAGPDLPASRPPETHPPLHFHPGPVSGPPLDPQVHRGCHHLPHHGEDKAALADTKKKQQTARLGTEPIELSFLLQILALVAVRKAMDYVFSQHDLSYLDDVIPEKDKKKREDEKKKKHKKKGSIDSEMEFVSVQCKF